MSEVILECKLARDYALENMAGSLCYLLIKATPNPAVSFNSLPLNLSLVIDVSASMKGNKMQHAKEASKFVIESLSPDDLVSIIIFSDDARAIVPLSATSEKDSILTAIDRIGPVSGTRMFKGLETAIAEIRKAPEQSYINSMIILTDGETEGEDQCLAIAQQEARNNLSISAFGIGDQYNEELLKSIADTTLGKIYHLQTAEQIRVHFENEVSTARAAVITNGSLNLCLASDIKLEEIHRIFPNSAKLKPKIESDGKTYTIDINNLRVNETSCFGVKMILPSREGGSVMEAQVSVKYDVPSQGIKGQMDKCNVIVEYTDDRDLCSRIDREVIGYFNQLNVESLIGQAIENTRVGNVAEATRVLTQAQMLTQKLGNLSLTRSLTQATVELNERGTISPSITKTIRVGASHTVRIDNPDLKE